ncbi:hypothetical protein [Sphingomonas sp. UYEF23]|uniref:hypothetical protein n=1 Tax=Sphingomonas sp. UYEF23 TaxID=1756408 RepID=UPI00339279D8
MLSALEARGSAAGAVAAERARVRVAEALRSALPGVAISIEGEHVVLSGRIAPDDPRLRWIGSLLA